MSCQTDLASRAQKLPLECWALILYFACPNLEDLVKLSAINKGIRNLTWDSPAFKASILIRMLKSTDQQFNHLHTPYRVYSFYKLPDAKLVIDALVKMGYTKMVSGGAVSIAISFEMMDMLRVLLKDCGVVVSPHLLYDALQNGSIHTIKVILSLSDVVVDSNAVLMAASRGELAVFVLMLERLATQLRQLSSSSSQQDANSANPIEDDLDIEKAMIMKHYTTLQASLVTAVENDCIEIVEHLLDKGVDHPEAVRRAAELDHEDAMRVLAHHACRLQRPQIYVSNIPPSWTTMVEIAARMGHENTLRSLLGIHDPLFELADIASIRPLETHLNVPKSSSDYSLRSLDSAVQLAVLNGHKNSVRILLKAGAVGGRLSYTTAISTDQADMLGLLLSASNTNSNKPPSGIITFALDRRSFSCVVTLLEHDQWPSATDILFAAKAEDIQLWMLNLLVLAGRSEARESLAIAIHEQAEESVLRRLIKAGVRPDESLVTSIVFLDREAILKVILEESSKLHGPPTGLVVTCAVDAGKLNMVQLLLDCGACGSASDLYIAARKGYHSIVRLLLSKDSQLGRVPLDLSIQRSEIQVLQVLLDHGVKPGKHSIIHAIESGNVAIIKSVLQSTKMHDDLSREICGVLFQTAFQTGQEEILELLFDVGKLIPLEGDIIRAAQCENTAMLRSLISRCPPEIKSSALDIALHENQLKVITSLVENGVKPHMHAYAVAVTKNLPQVIRVMLRTDPSLADIVSTLVVRNGTRDMMMILVDEFNVPVSVVSLLLAARKGNQEIIQYLLEQKYFMDMETYEELKEAANTLNVELIMKLVSKKPIVDKQISVDHSIQ
jgi:ankyrin repeat protein